MRRDGPSDAGVTDANTCLSEPALRASESFRATLIADDLTGACDAGALFAGCGPVGIFVAPASPGLEWTAAAVDTESRGLAPPAAAEAVRTAAGRLGARAGHGLLFKKIDSTLRGSVGAETEALLTASGRRAALLCPAFPGQQRGVVGGILLVNGAPAHTSTIARDPSYPGPGSDVVEIVRRGTSRAVDFVPLACVRRDPTGLVRALGEGAGHIIVADAETEDDLDALARAALACGDMMLAGSAGLAGAAAAASGQAGLQVTLPKGRAWLIIVGSLHPATRVQIRRLEATGVAGVWLHASRNDPDVGPLVEQIRAGQPAFIASDDAVSTEPDARRTTAGRLGDLAARVLAESEPDLVVVSGGDTAVALLRAVDATRIELSGAPASGLALGRVVIGAAHTFPVLTKAGGFGAPDLFPRLLGDIPR